MAKPLNIRPRPNVIVIKCKMHPLPPGTKSRARLPRGLETELPSRWGRWSIAGVVLAILVLGVAIGRFVVPRFLF